MCHALGHTYFGQPKATAECVIIDCLSIGVNSARGYLTILRLYEKKIGVAAVAKIAGIVILIIVEL
jgi:hypothetical protein